MSDKLDDLHSPAWVRELSAPLSPAKLSDRQWSAGCGGYRNEGQCPECYGLSPAWVTRALSVNRQRYLPCGAGHHLSCPLGKLLVAAGEPVLFAQGPVSSGSAAGGREWVQGLFENLIDTTVARSELTVSEKPRWMPLADALSAVATACNDTWVDVPAHQVLKVSSERFDNEFVEVHGSEHQEHAWRRLADGRLFRRPRYHFAACDMGRVMFLEPVDVAPPARVCSVCQQPVRGGHCACV